MRNLRATVSESELEQCHLAPSKLRGGSILFSRSLLNRKRQANTCSAALSGFDTAARSVRQWAPSFAEPLRGCPFRSNSFHWIGTELAPLRLAQIGSDRVKWTQSGAASQCLAHLRAPHRSHLEWPSRANRSSSPSPVNE